MRSCLVVLALALVACGGDGGTSYVPPRDMGKAPIDPGNPSGDCPEPTGPGVTHAGFLSADETWTAADSPHRITSELSVRGATLTLEPCTVVMLDKGVNFVVGDNSGAPAALVAHGAAEGEEILRPVIFTAADEASHWGSLRVLATGTADLQLVVLHRGGDPSTAQGYGGALQSRGDDNRVAPVQNIRALGVIILDSASFGFAVQGSGGFTDDSDQLYVNASGSGGTTSAGVDSSYVGILEAPSIHTLPAGGYTGNARDEILIRTPFAATSDETIRDRGVPYQVVYDFEIKPASAGGQNTLTIEPGVTLKFGGALYAGYGMYLGDGGNPVARTRLVAAGTADKPILFTSGSQVPGDWRGIIWQGGPATGNVMSHVTVEYGGGESGTNGFGCGPGDNDSLVLITNWQPGEAFITNSTFRSSAAGGIVSGYSSDVSGPDLKSGNTFSGIANGCDVSVQKNAAGQCPGNDFNPDCY